MPTLRLIAQHGRHQITTPIVVRCIRKRFVARQAGRNLVSPKKVDDFNRVRHRLYTLRVDLRQLINVADDLSQFAGNSRKLSLSKLKTRQQCDLFNVLARNAHRTLYSLLDLQLPRNSRVTTKAASGLLLFRSNVRNLEWG